MPMTVYESNLLIEEMAQALQKHRGSKYWTDISAAQKKKWRSEAKKLAWNTPTLRTMIWGPPK